MKTKEKEKTMILQDNLWRVMWRLSWPAVIAMVLFGLNVVFDAIFVGRYVGEEALAGVSVAYPITQLSLGFGSWVGVGAGSLLSILLGQEDQKTPKRLVGNATYLILVMGIAMAVLGILTMTPLLHLMGATGDNLVYGKDYLQIVLLGSILWIGGIGYNMIIRSEGKMATAAWMMGLGLAINVIANYIFMVIFDFGVVGAAWGTNIGMAVYILLFFRYCTKGRASFDTNVGKIYRDKELSREILKLGFPSFLMTIMTVIQGMIIMSSLNRYGTTEDVAFYGMVFRIFNLSLTPIYGLMRALQPAIGINFGAKKYLRVISSFKIFALVAFLIMFPLWVLAMVFPANIFHIMLPKKDFSLESINNFRIFMSIGPFLPVVLMAMTFWPAIKKPKPAGIIGIARQAFLYIPAMIFLPRLLGIDWIYKGSFLIDFSLTILIVILIRREFKRLRQKKSMETGEILPE